MSTWTTVAGLLGALVGVLSAIAGIVLLPSQRAKTKAETMSIITNAAIGTISALQARVAELEATVKRLEANQICTLCKSAMG